MSARWGSAARRNVAAVDRGRRVTSLHRRACRRRRGYRSGPRCGHGTAKEQGDVQSGRSASICCRLISHRAGFHQPCFTNFLGQALRTVERLGPSIRALDLGGGPRGPVAPLGAARPTNEADQEIASASTIVNVELRTPFIELIGHAERLASRLAPDYQSPAGTNCCQLTTGHCQGTDVVS